MFHVHTYRCKHAAREPVEEYIKTAAQMGARKITFTDHCPFPKNPFGGRMNDTELPEYIKELMELKEKYCENIEVNIGLEVEYLPKYRSYYEELAEQVELLILGQHFYQIAEDKYSFSLNIEERMEEAYGLGEAMVEGMHTGLFKVVAHPDRIFRRKHEWTREVEEISKNIIEAAVSENLILEQNLASIERNLYRPEFWKLLPKEVTTIIGTDAHSLKQLKHFKEFI